MYQMREVFPTPKASQKQAVRTFSRRYQSVSGWADFGEKAMGIAALHPSYRVFRGAVSVP